MSIIRRVGAVRNRIDAGTAYSLYGGGIIIIIVLCVYFLLIAS